MSDIDFNQIYAAELADALEYPARRAEADRERAQAEIAKTAARVAEGDRANSRFNSDDLASYDFCLEVEKRLVQSMKYLRSGAVEGIVERDEQTPPQERVAWLGRYYEQQLARVLSAVAGAWSTVGEWELRADAAEVEALRSSESQAWREVVKAAMPAAESAEIQERIRSFKVQAREAGDALARARNEQRIAELKDKANGARDAAALAEAELFRLRDEAEARVRASVPRIISA